MLSGFFFLLHPKFQKHPYRIYALANLSEGILYINGFYTNFTCNLHLPQIMTFTLSVFRRSASPAVSNLNHMRLLQLMNKFSFELGIVLYMYWNGIILLDVYLTISYPFYPRGKRVKYYYLGMLMMILYQVTFYIIYNPQGPGFPSQMKLN